ncbi:MAG: hypothetical protein M1819_004278 [Sarea resinae]|nr:MAG: hypothetical protein M1819_004278 [Sarea resinae]
MLLKSLAFFAAVAPCVFADVKFTTPAAGAVLSPGTLDIKWKDSGDAPSISDLKSYQLFLCAGGNEEGQYTQLSALQTQGEFSSGNAASGTVAAGLGGSTTNA